MTDMVEGPVAAPMPQAAGTTQAGIPWREAILIWLATAAALLIGYWGSLDDTLRSPDNVMRLVEVRAFLAGAPWFDPFEPRLAPPDGYVTHWSRLVDIGLVAVYGAARLFVAPEIAERVMRAVWPLLLVLPAILACTAIAHRLADAAFAGLVFAVSCAALLPTFRPGEIDHHNAQILLVLIATACVFFADRSRAAAMGAGLAGALLLGVGFEAIYMFVIIMACVAVIGVLRPVEWARPAAWILGTLAVAILAVWLGTTPAVLRFRGVCDALSMNVAIPVAIAGAGTASLLMWAARVSLLLRLGGLALVGLASAVAFGVLEPLCLKGPFAALDPAVFPIWLDRVEEVQSLWSLAKTDPMDAIIHMAFPCVALAGLIYLARRGFPCPQAWIVGAIFLAACAVMVMQVRGALFAIWLGVPLAAAAVQAVASRAPARRAELVRLAGLALANPIVSTLAVSVVGGLYTELSPRGETIKETRADNKSLAPCAQPASFTELNRLPSGLVMGHLDFGPSILAHTHHRVVAAPYHRIHQAIIFNQQVLEGPVAAARARVLASGVDYVVECKAFYTRDARKLAARGTDMLRLALLEEKSLDWLERVPTDAASPVMIWRVKR